MARITEKDLLLVYNVCINTFILHRLSSVILLNSHLISEEIALDFKKAVKILYENAKNSPKHRKAISHTSRMQTQTTLRHTSLTDNVR